MINRIKKISSLLIALVFMLTLSIGNQKVQASEEKEGSIIILDTEVGKEYRLYRIFNLTYNDGNVSYTINEKWKDFFVNGDGQDYIVDENEDDLNPIVIDGKTKYIDITDYNVDEFAMTAFKYASTMDPDKSENGNGDELNIPVGKDLGYYLIYPKGATETLEGQASIVSLTSTTLEGIVEIKSTYPTIDKVADKTTADFGEPIEYTLTGKVPDTTGFSKYIYKISDKLSKGLTLDKKSIVIYVDDLEIDYASSFIKIDSINDDGFTISFDVKNMQDYVGDEIKVKYQASLNSNAIIGKDGNDNKATLDYSNDPKNPDATEQTPPVIVKVYTAGIRVIKIDGLYGTPLRDAKFVLRNSEGYYYKLNHDDNIVQWVDTREQADEMTTTSDGKVIFMGLKADTYYLEETQAPAGYNKLTEDVEVEITEEKAKNIGVIEIKVENNSGVELPDTGGKGKLLFATVGGAVIIIALFSIARDRIKKERN